jgi:hypothetical protein
MFSIIAARALTSTVFAAALGCCCGPTPPDPQPVELAGTWVLDGEVPTGSALGTLTDVEFVFVSDHPAGDHFLRGRSDAADLQIVAQVRMSGPADPRFTQFGIVHSPAGASAETHFALTAAGVMSNRSTFHLMFSSPSDPDLTGAATLRRR